MNSVKSWDTKLKQKSVAFLYTNDRSSEREVKETIAFIISSEEYPKIPRNKPS